MAYVYRHIRLDTNQIFYIGIGNHDNYRRAKNKQSRNQFWHNIVNKTKRIVEIFIDDITWEEAIKKEIEFIQFYGRRDLGKGTLVNLTDGGEGCIGHKTSDITKAKLRAERVGKKHSPDAIDKMKRRVQSKESIEKGISTRAGYKHSPETLAKMRGRKLPQHVKDIIGHKNKIRVRTDQEKLNMSIAGKLRVANTKK